MPDPFLNAIAQAKEGHNLEAADVEELIGTMLSGEAEDQQIADLLLALRAKGEAVSELVGAARAMRRHMTPISSDASLLVDTCGTGGDGSGTFNISTAAAIVTAAAGVPVAKHGNRAITSKSGSADVLSELGVNIDVGRDVIEKSLAEAGICFCFAPRMHPAMKHVGAIRRQLAVPTLFNLLGPLCNPAGATHQILGTGSDSVQQQLAAALQQLDTQHSIVVRGLDGLDEVTLQGPTSVVEVTSDGLTEKEWTAESFGLNQAGPETMQADGPTESAAVIGKVFDGDAGASRDIVIANAAAAIWLSDNAPDLRLAAEKASEAIDSGNAKSTLKKLVAITSV